MTHVLNYEDGNREPVNPAGRPKIGFPLISPFADKKNGNNTMTINFECKKCHREFDCDVGRIGIDDTGMCPTFEKDIVCPKCGKLTMDYVFLTELGQSQMTEATMGL